MYASIYKCFIVMANNMLNEGMKLTLHQYILANFYHKMCVTTAKLREKLGKILWG